MIMDVEALSTQTVARDHFWDWGPTMYFARKYARTTGVRRRVFGVKTRQGWQYHCAATWRAAR